MNTRVKAVRKHLKLSQTAFGAKINLKQRTIADIEAGRNSLTERNFQSICRVFNVNPTWLRTGEGVMFNPQDKNTYLENLAKEYGLKPEHKVLIESILELPPEIWQYVVEWIKNCANKLQIQSSVQLQENRRRELEQQIHDAQKELADLNHSINRFESSDDQLTRAEAHALLDEELDAVQKSREKFSVSTSINGLAKNNL